MGNVANRYKQEAKELDKKGIQAEHMVGMLNMIRHINEAKSLRDATRIVVEEACEMLSCDRATVFLVDKENEQLVIKHATNDDALDIRIPWNTGIAGHVYLSGETVNIPDAYKDDRFNQEADVTTGYKTNSILCCPIKDGNGATEAVLQCINKKGPKGALVPFVEKDIFILNHLRSQLGVILQNYMVLDMQRATQERITALLDIIKSVNSGMGTASLIFTLTNRTPALVHAERCTVFMIDHGRSEIYSMQGAVEIRLPITSGLAGAVATSGETLNIKDAYEDPRFNQEFDLKNKFRTKQVLVLPIKSADGERIIGVIQLINKQIGETFTDQDVDLLNIFLAIAGGILEQAVVITRQKRRLTEFERMTKGHTTKGTGAQSTGMSSLGTFAESEEDEEDEEDD